MGKSADGLAQSKPMVTAPVAIHPNAEPSFLRVKVTTSKSGEPSILVGDRVMAGVAVKETSGPSEN